MNASLRPKVGDGLVMSVAHRLTERDRSILTMLYRHRVLTTDRLAEMYFSNVNTAQDRLTTLYKLRLLDRFQPLDHRYASLPYHYVLDQLGAMVIAAEHGEDPDKSRWRSDKALAIGKSQRLRHLSRSARSSQRSWQSPGEAKTATSRPGGPNATAPPISSGSLNRTASGCGRRPATRSSSAWSWSTTARPRRSIAWR